MVVERITPFWSDDVVTFIRSGKNVLITGHGNSLRALVKYLENVPEEEVDKIDVPNAEPIIYTFDSQAVLQERLG